MTRQESEVLKLLNGDKEERTISTMIFPTT